MDHLTGVALKVNVHISGSVETYCKHTWGNTFYAELNVFYVTGLHIIFCLHYTTTNNIRLFFSESAEQPSLHECNKTQSLYILYVHILNMPSDLSYGFIACRGVFFISEYLKFENHNMAVLDSHCNVCYSSVVSRVLARLIERRISIKSKFHLFNCLYILPSILEFLLFVYI